VLASKLGRHVALRSWQRHVRVTSTQLAAGRDPPERPLYCGIFTPLKLVMTVMFTVMVLSLVVMHVNHPDTMKGLKDAFKPRSPPPSPNAPQSPPSPPSPPNEVRKPDAPARRQMPLAA
jgi:hypothetical protein